MTTLAQQEVILEQIIRPIINKTNVSEVTKGTVEILLEVYNGTVYGNDGSTVGTGVSKFLKTFVGDGWNKADYKTLVDNKFVGQPKRSILKIKE